jgi:hypothetical protein
MFPAANATSTSAPAAVVRQTIVPSCNPVTNPYGAVCVANSDPTFNFKCTTDSSNCTGPSLWAIFTDTVED